MKKVIALTLGVGFLITGLAFGQSTSPATQVVVQSVEVGNKHCPVSGREVGVMGPAFKVEYNGKTYNLCCPGCKGKFLAEHEKYGKIAEDNVASQK